MSGGLTGYPLFFFTWHFFSLLLGKQGIDGRFPSIQPVRENPYTPELESAPEPLYKKLYVTGAKKLYVTGAYIYGNPHEMDTK